MAKQKTSGLVTGLKELTPAEKAQIESEINRFGRELSDQEREAAKVGVSTAAEGTAVESPPITKRFRVKLKHNPTIEVEAADQDEAFALYKQRQNILKSDHAAVIEEVVSAGV